MISTGVVVQGGSKASPTCPARVIANGSPRAVAGIARKAPCQSSARSHSSKCAARATGSGFSPSSDFRDGHLPVLFLGNHGGRAQGLQQRLKQRAGYHGPGRRRSRSMPPSPQRDHALLLSDLQPVSHQYPAASACLPRCLDALAHL
jgi:hypothetical protein